MRFDFVLARAKHLHWRGRLRTFLDGRGTLTLEEAISHRDCELGRWLYAEGLARYGELPEVRELEREHEAMHADVRAAVELTAAGRTAEAEQRYQAVSAASRRIVALLTALDRRVQAA